MTNKVTKSTKYSDIKREWHAIDLKNKTLGRVATEISLLLMGKSKPYFVHNLDCGDYVIVTNAKNVRVTGRKELQKTYYRHSGYPKGLKEETLQKLRQRKPTEIILHAVKGMLPQNRLRDRMLKRLYIYADDNHPYKEKFTQK